MLTRVKVDDDLLKEAKEIGKHRSGKEAAIAALREYIEFHQGELRGEFNRQADRKFRPK